MVFGVDDLVLAGGLAAAGGIGGSAIGGSATVAAQEAANAANMQMAKDNRDWQTYMSNTAHAREVIDLRSAGLNPILAAHGGASTPSGSVATANPVTGNAWVGNAVEKALGSAAQVMQLKKDLEQKDAQIAATKAGAVASVAQANNAQASAAATQATMPKIVAESDAAGAMAGAKKAQAEIDRDWAKYDATVGRVLQAIGGVTDAVNLKRILQGTRNDQRNQTMKEERHLYQQRDAGSSLK